MQGGQLLSRSLKPIPNKNVQELFRNLPEGIDGELIQGKLFDDPYRRTVSVVMSDDKPADGIQLHVFDKFMEQGTGPIRSFESRFNFIRSLGLETQFEVVIVPHFPVVDMGGLERYENMFLDQGYEGLMIRDPFGPYKNGRSSEKEGWLLKVKRFEDAEAVIVGTYEEMENQNEAFTNELGRTARSTAKAGKIGKNRLGGFHVVGAGGAYNNVEFDVASGAIDHETRVILWADRENLLGKVIVYKYFPTGGDTRPRHPIFKGIRHSEDLS